MPITLDDLDSPLLTDQQSSFVGGQLSNAAPVQVGEDTCCLIEDCEVSITGQAQSRRGTAKLGNNQVSGGSFIRGLGFFVTPPSTVWPLAISGTAVNHFDGTTWATAGLSPSNFANGTQPVTLLEGNSKLYGTDGLGSIKTWNGSDLSNWGVLTTDSPPTDVKYLIWHTNRLVAANATVGGNPSLDGVFFSGILDDTIWATLSGGYQVQPGAGDGRPITQIVPWSNFNIAVFKQSSTWLIGADPQLDVAAMPVTMVHGRIGCIAPRSAVQVGSDILFLSQDGVRSLQQTIASDSRYELGLPLSFPIQDIIRRLNAGAMANSAAVFWKGLYLLAVPLDSSSTNNYILIWNSVTGKWSGGWTNLPVSCFGVRTDSNGVERLMMGLSNATWVIEYLDYVAESSATDATYTDWNAIFVAPHIVTRGMMFGDLHSPKKGFNVNVVLNKSKGTINFTALFDEGASQTTASINTGDPNGFPIPFTLPISFPHPGLQRTSMSLMSLQQFNQVQFEIKSVTIGRKEFRQITAQAFPEPIDMKGQFVSTGVLN